MLTSRSARLRRTRAAVDALALPPAIWKTCPWEPRDLIETGLRQWLRCAGAAILDDQTIGMPSRAVDEAWHGLILCTGRYARFCDAAYGRLLHHHPEGDHVHGEAAPVSSRGRWGRSAPSSQPPATMEEQLARTVAAWSIVADPGERCVLWDLDRRACVDEPWGIEAALVAELEQALGPKRC